MKTIYLSLSVVEASRDVTRLADHISVASKKVMLIPVPYLLFHLCIRVHAGSCVAARVHGLDINLPQCAKISRAEFS